MYKGDSIRDLVIWVGAGVSMCEPSCLPSGNSLTEFVLDEMILDKERLLVIWNQVNAYEQKYLEINKYPRLELILSSIAFVERNFKKGKFLNGFKSFNEVPINKNHLLLACLVYKGATILTANFDFGIERAYQYLFHGYNENEIWGKDEALISPNGGKVIHFHGTCMDGKRMGATIENIVKLVNKDMYRHVHNSFGENKHNIFLGYSFSDVYDINTIIKGVYFADCTKYTKKNDVCNHKGYDKKLEGKCVNIFGMDNVHVFSGDTTDVIMTLCKEYNADIPENNLNVDRKVKDSEKWKDIFRKHIKVTNEFKVLATIHLLNRMGIAVDKVNENILNQYKTIKLKNDKKIILDYYLATNSWYWYEKYKDVNLDEYHARKLYERVMQSKLDNHAYGEFSCQDVNTEIESVKRKDFVSYENFNNLSKRMGIIKLALVKNTELLDVHGAKRLLDAFKMFPVGKFIEIILYASVQRYQMFMEGIENGTEIDVFFSTANDIYYDIGNIDGIMCCQLDRMISKYYKKDATIWKDVFKTEEWKNIKQLSEISGSYRYRQIFAEIEYLRG